MKSNLQRATEKHHSKMSTATSVAPDLASRIVSWLLERQQPSGAIRGDNGADSPSDHYAHSFAALALGLEAEIRASPELWANAERSAAYTLSLPFAIRHIQEFNSLALLLLAGTARASPTAPQSLRGTLESAVSNPRFVYDGNRQVSNNWLAMRAACFVLHGKLADNCRSKERGEELMQEILRYFDGVFVDYPRHFDPQKPYATPLTYHAKACAMMAVAAQSSPMPEWISALRSGLVLLNGLMSPGGECLYYGRSCNSLFGLAAAYYAFQSASSLLPDDPDIESWQRAAALLTIRLAALQEPDGHLRITPGKNEAERAGWDVYYHTEVYNAYAAALLLAAPRISIEGAAITTVQQDEIAVLRLNNAGVASLKDSRIFAAFSTRGQCVLEGSSLFCDMRYSGLQPLLIEMGTEVQVPEQPLFWTGQRTKADAVSPCRTGFVPYISWQGQDYCARIFDETVNIDADGIYGCCGRGIALALSLPSRKTRLLGRLKRKLTGHGDLAFTSWKLAEITILRAVLLIPSKRALLVIDGFEGSLPQGAVWQGPNARMMPGASLIAQNLMDERPLKKTCAIPTSRGAADLYECDPAGVVPSSPGCVSATLCSPAELVVSAKTEGYAIRIALDELSLLINLQTGSVKSQVIT